MTILCLRGRSGSVVQGSQAAPQPLRCHSAGPQTERCGMQAAQSMEHSSATPRRVHFEGGSSVLSGKVVMKLRPVRRLMMYAGASYTPTFLRSLACRGRAHQHEQAAQAGALCGHSAGWLWVRKHRTLRGQKPVTRLGARCPNDWVEQRRPLRQPQHRGVQGKHLHAGDV